MDRDRVKDFSALISRYLKIDLRPFLAPHKSKIFLAMRGVPPNRRGTPPSGTPCFTFLKGDGAEKVITFFNNIFQTKNIVWGLNRASFSLFEIRI
jgi:hypothetical protein